MPLLAGLTGGAFLTLAVQTLLAGHGMQVGDVWQNVASGGQLNLRAALVWWVIAGSALVAGAALAGVLVRLPAPWHSYRGLRWIVAGVALYLFAATAHGVEPPEHIGALTQLLASAGAIAIGALLGAFGAVFALKR
jgi:hypothetical protein